MKSVLPKQFLFIELIDNSPDTRRTKTGWVRYLDRSQSGNTIKIVNDFILTGILQVHNTNFNGDTQYKLNKKMAGRFMRDSEFYKFLKKNEKLFGAVVIDSWI